MIARSSISGTLVIRHGIGSLCFCRVGVGPPSRQRAPVPVLSTNRQRSLNTDICPTGGRSLTCFTLVGASHQLRRFIALQPKDERGRRSMRSSIRSCPSSGIDRALGLLLSRALSSRSTSTILSSRLLKSSIFTLQFFIDLAVGFDQRDTAVQSMLNLFEKPRVKGLGIQPPKYLSLPVSNSHR